MSIESILDNTRKYLTKKENEEILRAFIFADKVHRQTRRSSGQPYIIHPLKIAYSLSEDRLDAPTIIASMLHDIPEDTDVTLETIHKKFGKEVAELVDGVTKLSKIKLKKQWFFPVSLISRISGEQKKIFEQQVDNLRKMLLAMTKDIRVILIKLADRLHNMQTLDHLPMEKRIRIAQETLEIYAPIAYRLGIGHLKGTLEDLAFPYVYPKEYLETKKLVGKKYEEKEVYIDRLKKTLSNMLNKNNINYEQINGRRKHLYSLWIKLQHNNNDISKIYDLVALRIVVKSIEDCYKVLGFVHKLYKPLIGRIKDYIAVSKPNGYQSLHTTVFGPEGEIVEIQIRTNEMHEQAEFGISAHWHYSQYKPDFKGVSDARPQALTSKLQTDWLRELARWQEKMNDPQEWSDGLKMDFFQDQIFVFSPAGDVYNLPSGATPVDFAYAVHSNIGDNCSGAKVNGKIVKLNRQLENGQIIEIIVDKKSKGPKKDWLRFVKSHKARDRIKSYFSKK